MPKITLLQVPVELTLALPPNVIQMHPKTFAALMEQLAAPTVLITDEAARDI